MLVNNCIGIRNMRTFVTFIGTSYILAMLTLVRVTFIAVYVVKLGVVEINTVKAIVIIILLLLSIPTYYFMVNEDSY